MRCEKCGKDFMESQGRCPHCGASVRYSGNTQFYRDVSGQKLNVIDVFSDLFRPHPKGSGAKLFMAGTSLSTPTPDRMLAEWQKPWIFLRVFGVGLIFCMFCYLLYFLFEGGLVGFTTLMIFSLFVGPVTFLVFAWEMNIPRDIPLYHVLLVLLLGGMLSLFFSFIGFELQESGAPAAWAAFAEEPGKLIAAAVFICLFRVKYGLGGMLIGAAVGAGFTIFEDIMYAIAYGAFVDRLIGVGGHYLWGAAEGGAFALSLNGQKFSADVFRNKYLWIAFGGSVITHYLWNYLAETGRLNVVMLLLIIVLKFVLVYIVLKPCLKQVVDISARAVSAAPAPQSAPAISALRGTQGVYSGETIPLKTGYAMKIGRDPQQNQLILPSDAVGVSREHCSLVCSGGGWALVDHSSAGTQLNGVQIQRNVSYPLKPGDTISIGTPANSFVVS